MFQYFVGFATLISSGEWGVGSGEREVGSGEWGERREEREFSLNN